jgi:hypothetical protein
MTKLTQQFPFPVSKVPRPNVFEDSATWLDKETADARLSKRLRALLGQLANDVGAPIPFACQDWANTKAAYRFLSNERVNEAAILAGHFQSTASRFAACSGLVLVLQDTTACRRFIHLLHNTYTKGGCSNASSERRIIRFHLVNVGAHVRNLQAVAPFDDLINSTPVCIRTLPSAHNKDRSRRNTRLALTPPKPKPLEIA